MKLVMEKRPVDLCVYCLIQVFPSKCHEFYSKTNIEQSIGVRDSLDNVENEDEMMKILVQWWL